MSKTQSLIMLLFVLLCRKLNANATALMGRRVGESSTVKVSDTMKYNVKILKIEKGEDNTELPISEY